jgi:hypothetical protein
MERVTFHNNDSLILRAVENGRGPGKSLKPLFDQFG